MTGVAGPCGVRAGWSPPRIIQPSTATTLTAPGRCWPSRETPLPWCSPTFSWRTTMMCWRSAARRDLRSGELSARSPFACRENKRAKERKTFTAFLPADMKECDAAVLKRQFADSPLLCIPFFVFIFLVGPKLRLQHQTSCCLYANP